MTSVGRIIGIMAVLALLASGYVLSEAIEYLDEVRLEREALAEEARLAKIIAAAPQHKAKVIAPSPTEKMLEGIFKAEAICLHKNIYFEARNQNNLSRLAVGWVTINRFRSDRYPNKICEVVKQGKRYKSGRMKRNQCQFSWWCDGKSDEPNLNNPIELKAWQETKQIALQLMRSCLIISSKACPADPTNGAMYYHGKQVSPHWRHALTETTILENHIFYVRN